MRGTGRSEQEHVQFLDVVKADFRRCTLLTHPRPLVNRYAAGPFTTLIRRGSFTEISSRQTCSLHSMTRNRFPR